MNLHVQFSLWGIASQLPTNLKYRGNFRAGPKQCFTNMQVDRHGNKMQQHLFFTGTLSQTDNPVQRSHKRRPRRTECDHFWTCTQRSTNASSNSSNA